MFVSSSYLVAINLSKAFNCINHYLLLNVLQLCSLNANSIKWLVSYISHHMQQVKYAGAPSDAIPLTSSVAQESNLGLTLWNIYNNDLFHIFLNDSVVHTQMTSRFLLTVTEQPDLQEKCNEFWTVLCHSAIYMVS